MKCEEPGEPFGWRQREQVGLLGNQVFDPWPELPAAAPGGQQRRQPAEIAIDQHLVDAGLFGNGVDADAGEAFAREHLADGGEDALLGLFPVPDLAHARMIARNSRRGVALGGVP